MIDVHDHAMALLEALAARDLRVYDSGAGTKPDGTFETPKPPYVVVYIDGGARSAQSLADDHDEQAEFDAEIWSVGTSPRSARAVQSAVLSLIGQALTVDGRVAYVRAAFSDRVRPDRDDPRTALFQGRDGVTVVSGAG